jgi:hypothetical protein
MREPSVAVDLSDLDAPAKQPSFSLVPAGVPRRRGRTWLLVFLVVAVLAAAGYVRRQEVVPALRRLQQRVVTKTRVLLSANAEGSERCPGRAEPDGRGEG